MTKVQKTERAISINANTPVNHRFMCMNLRRMISKSDTMKPMISARNESVMAAGNTTATIMSIQNQKPYLDAFAIR